MDERAPAPDWRQLAAQRLGRLKLAPEERREVIAEVAAHLDDCYRELCAAGSPDPEGYALARVPDWKALGRKIQASKEDPMNFPRRVFVPGLMALVLAQALMSTSHHLLVPLFGVPTAWQFKWSVPAYYVPWLLALPLAVALGSWLSRRAGGRPGQRFTAALFPAFFAPVAMVALVIRVTFFVPQDALETFNFFEWLLAWVLLPALACGIGAMPLLSGAAREAEQTPPTHPASA